MQILVEVFEPLDDTQRYWDKLGFPVTKRTKFVPEAQAHKYKRVHPLEPHTPAPSIRPQRSPERAPAFLSQGGSFTAECGCTYTQDRRGNIKIQRPCRRGSECTLTGNSA